MIYTIEESTAKSLADQVRRLTGTTDEMGTDEMAVKLKSVEVGGGNSSGDDIARLIEGTLTEINDNKVDIIRSYGFYSHPSITTVKFPYCTEVSEYAFAGCDSLTHVDIPACTTIGRSAFLNCTNLTTINAPACTFVDYTTFGNCSKLTAANFPECSYVNTYAFQNCFNISEINFPKCTRIYGWGFKDCRNLTDVDLPLCSYIDSAFLYCSKLTTVNLPVCNTIGSNAFQNCSSLKSISAPICTTISNAAFQNCSSLESVYFSLCTSIGSSAFQNCSSLTSVNVPACTTISNYTFHNCTSLESVDFPLCSRIEISAFASCYNLTTANFPNCNYISSYAFQRCSMLTEINIPMCYRIYSGVFYLCINLSSINLPTCSIIGSYAFQCCSNLTTLLLGYSSVVTLSNSQAFQYTPIADSSYTGSFGSIYVPESLFESYKTATNWSYYSNRLAKLQGIFMIAENHSENLILNSTSNMSVGIIPADGVSSLNVTSSDEAVVSVSNVVIDGKNITFDVTTHDNEGSTEIIVSAFYNGESYSATMNMFVEDLCEIAEIDDIKISFNKEKNISTSLLHMTSIPEVTVISSDDSIISISNVMTNQESITFDILSHSVESSAEITITAICNNRTYTTTFTINVHENLPTYSVEELNTTYSFKLNNNNYYESNNKGVDDSFAICKVNISTPIDTTMHVDCINYAESSYDYGILSNLDTTLTLNKTADTVNVKQSFKSKQSPDVQTVTYNVPAGDHYIYVKYIKDTSDAQNNDTLQFAIRLEY